MQWNNLKNFRCPNDGDLLKEGSNYYCERAGCGFRIGKEKFERLYKTITSPKGSRERLDNLSELNNLGRDEVQEDFGDSPSLDY